MWKSVEYYRLTTVRPDMVTIDGGHGFVTYVAAFSKLKTWAKTIIK